MSAVLVLVLAGFIGCGGLLLLRAADAADQRSSLVTFDLQFPRETSPDAVQGFLGAVSGLLPPWWRRWHHLPFVAIEVHADHRGISHRLLVPQALTQQIVSALSAHLPDVTFTRSTTPTRPQLRRGSEYRLSTGERMLQAEPEAQVAHLLASLQPLRVPGSVCVQAILAPARPASPARLQSAEDRRDRFTTTPGLLENTEAVAALKKKQAHRLLLASLRIGVAARSDRQARAILRQAETAWNGARAPGVMLRRRLIPASEVAGRLERLTVPLLGWPVLLNTAEAVGLVGLPVGAPTLPGLRLLSARPRPVPAAVPRTGSLLGDGTHPRTRRPVALDLNGRRHHALIVGPTGSGKSVLATHLIVSGLHDLKAAAVVIDPKDGSLVDGICEVLPEKRVRDVIVLDPTSERLVGFDPLASTTANRELIVDRVLGLMVDIWHTNIGPRSSDILRHVLLTVAAAPDLTMVEAPLVIADASYRRAVLAKLPDETALQAWWAWADGLSPAEWSSITAAPLNKLRAFVGRRSVAHTIGQAKPAIDFGRVLNNGQILLVRLSQGLLGDEANALLGAMVTNQVWHAIAARASIAPDQRRPDSVVIDEIETVLRFPSGVVESMLTQARGYGVGVTLAAQHLDQLPTSVRKTALANARTKVIFACSRDDAGVLARELGNGLTPDDLTGSEAYHAYAAVFADGKTQPAASIAATPPAPRQRPAEAVKSASAQRYGRLASDIDEELRRRNERSMHTSGPVGRRRRTTS